MTTKSAVKQAAEAHDKVAKMHAAFNAKWFKVSEKWTETHRAKIRELEDSLPPDVRAIYDRIGDE
jgi:predicted  nucleic acid-binding Zn-ribbon protein